LVRYDLEARIPFLIDIVIVRRAGAAVVPAVILVIIVIVNDNDLLEYILKLGCVVFTTPLLHHFQSSRLNDHSGLLPRQFQSQDFVVRSLCVSNVRDHCKLYPAL